MTASAAPASPAPLPRAARRRWLQISLRSALAAMLLVAVPLGLWANSANRQRRAVEAIRELGGGAWYDFELDVPPKPLEASWPVKLLGIDYFATVVEVSAPPGFERMEQSLPHWRELPHLKTLHFVNVGVSFNNDPIVTEAERTLPGVHINVAESTPCFEAP